MAGSAGREPACEDYGLLVAIGDRPDPTVTADLVKRVGQWRSSGVSVTLLNRHEANWSRLPELLKLGVENVSWAPTGPTFGAAMFDFKRPHMGADCCPLHA